MCWATSFDLSAVMSAASGTGGGSGKATISPLIVDLAATPGLADLLQKAATGQHIPEVIFIAQKSGERPFEYETIKLSNVFVVGYDEKAGFATRVALGFDKIEVELNELSPNGGGTGVSRTFAFDVARDGGDLGPVAPGALEPVVSTGDHLSRFDYFLHVDDPDIRGSSTDERHRGDFDIVGYEFDLAAAVSSHTGTGGGSGKTTFSPLVLDFAPSPGLAALLHNAATGKHIPELTFTVRTEGERAFDAETITLTEVTVVGYEEKAGFATRVAFGYRTIEVELVEQKADGSAGDSRVFSFDVARDGGALAPVGVLEPEVALDITADYFLHISGIFGGATDDRHRGDFDVLGYEFDLSAVMSAASGTGGGSGKATISPLIVDLAATPGLADLLQKAATGQHIPEVIFIAQKSGERPFEYETIKLSNVFVVGYDEKAGFATRVALGFDKIEVELNELSPNGGGTGVSRTFAFDVARDGGDLGPVAPGALEPVVSTGDHLSRFRLLPPCRRSRHPWQLNRRPSPGRFRYRRL